MDRFQAPGNGNNNHGEEAELLMVGTWRFCGQGSGKNSVHSPWSHPATWFMNAAHSLWSWMLAMQLLCAWASIQQSHCPSQWMATEQIQFACSLQVMGTVGLELGAALGAGLGRALGLALGAVLVVGGASSASLHRCAAGHGMAGTVGKSKPGPQTESIAQHWDLACASSCLRHVSQAAKVSAHDPLVVGTIIASPDNNKKNRTGGAQ